MITVVDYGLGNLFSVAKAFEMLGAEVVVTSDPYIVRTAERIVLPGVGAFGDGMRFLTERKLLPALEEAVRKNKVPFLGICLGMQFLAETGSEYGEHSGLGWIRGRVEKIEAGEKGLKVPHIGWNELSMNREHPLFAGIKQNADFYFVHSFHLIPADEEDLVAVTDYGGAITSAVARGNIAGIQFHPEKSQDNGLALLENFLKWSPNV